MQQPPSASHLQQLHQTKERHQGKTVETTIVEYQTYTRASPPRREDVCPRLPPLAHAHPHPGEDEPAPHVDHATPPPWKPRQPRERKPSFLPFWLVSRQPGDDL